ncbi:MAG: hypothetical protein ABSG16_24865, partial [Candidatus Acidiferrum sp.]
MIAALNSMLPEDTYAIGLKRDFWRTKLFENGFPKWLINSFMNSIMNWSITIPALFHGDVTS